jgi:hypothetical protein
MRHTSWSIHVTVEECHSLAVRELVKAGVFSALNARSGNLSWSEGVLSLGYKVLECDTKLYLVLVPDERSVGAAPAEQWVEIAKTSCNYGGFRHWLKCPGLPGAACGNSVADLYCPPGRISFACRNCHQLTYRSVQSHDKRIDRAAKDPSAIMWLLQSKNFRHRLLGVAALTKLEIRLLRGTSRTRSLPRRRSVGSTT